MKANDSNPTEDSSRATLTRLTEENIRLKELLRRHGIDPEPVSRDHSAKVATEKPPSPQITHRSPEDSKIALFRRLFKGRDDVYALRWEAKGKTGYSPASIRNWRAILKTSPADRKRVDRESRRLLPLTDDPIREHLVGKQIIGV